MCVVLYGVVVAATGLVTDHPDLWVIELALPVLFAVTLVYLHDLYPLSALSYALITLYFVLHALASASGIVGSPMGYLMSGWFGWERNNLDRVLHFIGGAVFAVPAREFLSSKFKINGFWGFVFPIVIVLSFSAAYELLEWKSAIMMDSVRADQFLGYQGDQWDTQKDMGLGLLGAIVSMSMAFMVSRIQRSRQIRRTRTSELSASLVQTRGVKSRKRGGLSKSVIDKPDRTATHSN